MLRNTESVSLCELLWHTWGSLKGGGTKQAVSNLSHTNQPGIVKEFFLSCHLSFASFGMED